MHLLKSRTHLLILIDILAFEGVYWATVFAAAYSSSSVNVSAYEYLAAAAILPGVQRNISGSDTITARLRPTMAGRKLSRSHFF